MTSQTSPLVAPLSRPTIKLLMVLCGAFGMAAAGVASATTMADTTPGLNIQFDPASLATDAGAREVYHRLEKAAERVCPAATTGTRIVSEAARQCREDAVARAVRKINDPRLVALDAVHAKRA